MINFLFTKTPLFFLTQSIWRDEAFSYLISKKSLLEIIQLTVKDFSPPFYYFILHFWMKIAGHSEIALRLPSFLAYLGVIYLAFLIFTDIFKFSLKKAYLYLLLFIFNPLLIIYAFEARMYTFFAFFTILSFYAYLTKKKHLYLAAAILGLFTHYFMLLVVLFQLLHSRFKFKPAFISLITFLPWIIFIFINKSGSDGMFWIKPVSLKDLLYLPSVLFTGYETNYGIVKATLSGLLMEIVRYSVAISILVGTSLYFTLKKIKTRNRTLLFLLLIWSFGFALTIFVVSFYKPLYIPRYLIFSTVGYLFLIVYVTDRLPKVMKAISLMILLFISFKFLSYQLQYDHKPDLRKPLNEIKKLAGSKDSVFVTSELDYFVAQYYFDEKRVYIYNKTYKEIPDYVGKVLIKPSSIAPALPLYPKKAFILNGDRTYDIRAQF